MAAILPTVHLVAITEADDPDTARVGGPAGEPGQLADLRDRVAGPRSATTATGRAGGGSCLTGRPRGTGRACRARRRGFADPARLEGFGKRVDTARTGLITLLDELADRGQRVVGYGATAKSATVTNFCGIGPDRVAFICDSTPAKQGQTGTGLAHSGTGARCLLRPVPAVRAALRLEPRRGDHGERAGVPCGRWQVDPLRARRACGLTEASWRTHW